MERIYIVLLPGIDGTGELFQPLINNLPKRITPIVVSYPRSRQCGYEELKRIVLDALPRESEFFILGESFSGPLAVMVASDRPEGLKGLILCASFISNPFRFIYSWMSIISIGSIYRLWPFLIMVRALYGGDKFKALAMMAIKTIKKVKPDVIAGRVKSILEINVEKELSSCYVPILYMMSTKDHLIKKHNFDKIKKIRNNVILTKIETRHFILQLEPMKAVEELVKFMDISLKTTGYNSIERENRINNPF